MFQILAFSLVGLQLALGFLGDTSEVADIYWREDEGKKLEIGSQTCEKDEFPFMVSQFYLHLNSRSTWVPLELMFLISAIFES